MKLIGNLIWLLFGGIISAILWFIAGVLLCITIIGIPFGIQCFKISRFVLWPFGKEVDIHLGFTSIIMNIIWIVLFGWELFILHLVVAFFMAITVIGIPFALQHIKFAQLSLFPFGAKLK
jgi:uncharacterized membrane protein YccF (DUF307 family)